jgi:hypothetical protein
MRSALASPKHWRALATLCLPLALATGAFAISGCGGAAATLDPIARAAEVTSKQGGAKFTLTVQLSSSLLPGGAIAVNAKGSIDQRQRSGEMTMDLSGIPGLSALAGGGTTAVQMIFKFPVIYMHMPFLAGKLPDGKTWMKLDIAKAAKAAGIDTSQLGSLNQTDPTQFLDYLRGSTGKVTTVGRESLHGVPTTRYRATLQLSKILDHLHGSQRTAAKATLEKLGSAGAIPVEVWVDGQGRLRRMEMTIASSGPASSLTTTSPSNGSVGVAGTVTFDITSYGPVPPITPPPSSEVFDASALAGGGLGSSGG